MVVDEFGQTEELGVRQCKLPTSEESVNSEEFLRVDPERDLRIRIRPLLHRAPAVSLITVMWRERAFMSIQVGLPPRL
jgi:hypothetical protein